VKAEMEPSVLFAEMEVLNTGKNSEFTARCA
jgi:hypothetical protein